MSSPSAKIRYGGESTVGTTDIVVLSICVLIVIAGMVFGYGQSKRSEELDISNSKKESK